MKTLLALTASAAALMLGGAAQAKGPIKAELCGAAACVAVSDEGTLRALSDAAFSDEAIALSPALPQAFYAFHLTFGEDPDSPHLTVYYLPVASLFRTTDGWTPATALWMAPGPDTESVLSPLTQTLAPFSPPKLTAAFVGARRVRNPASYLSLYAVRSAGTAVIRTADWLTIRLRSPTPSPWTDGANWLQYSPSARVLVRDGEFVKLPRRTASALQRRVPLPAVGRTGQPSSRFPSASHDSTASTKRSAAWIASSASSGVATASP